MKIKKIGFIGGCINNPKNISRDQVFHSVINQLLKNNDHNLASIVLGNYENYSQLYDRTKSFISKKRPDIIYLFVRPFPLLILNKAIIKYDIPDNKTKRSLNPFLLKRNLNWNSRFTDNQIITNNRGVRHRSISFQDFNLLLGQIGGLNKKSTNYIYDDIIKINNLCFKNQIKINIISAPQYYETIMSRVICKKMNQTLLKKLKDTSISTINIYDIGKEHFENDRIHYTASGHHILAKKIFNNLISNLG